MLTKEGILLNATITKIINCKLIFQFLSIADNGHIITKVKNKICIFLDNLI